MMPFGVGASKEFVSLSKKPQDRYTYIILPLKIQVCLIFGPLLYISRREGECTIYKPRLSAFRML